MKGIPTLLLVTVLVAACGGGGNGSPAPAPTQPSPQTADLTVIDDPACHHLGDENRSDPCQFRPEGESRSYSFSLTSHPVRGVLTVTVTDVGPTGADVLLNGRTVLEMPPPLGNGGASAQIQGDALRDGRNDLTIRSRRDGDLLEDFAYRNLRLVVTVEVS
jgi:hypothetical protein